MICPADAIQMHQKAQIGDGESNENAYATWSMLECFLCKRQVIEFHSVIVVDGAEDARIRGAMLVNQAMQGTTA